MRLYRSKYVDPGILPLVHELQRAGFHTCYSCEGGSGHQFKRPTVDVRTKPEERTQVRVRLGQWAQERNYSGVEYQYINRTPLGNPTKTTVWRLTWS